MLEKREFKSKVKKVNKNTLYNFQIIIIAQLVQWTGISYQKKSYPPWAEFLGWCLALASMILIPIFAINQYLNASGTFVREVSTAQGHSVQFCLGAVGSISGSFHRN